jgi:hypothetical protein
MDTAQLNHFKLVFSLSALKNYMMPCTATEYGYRGNMLHDCVWQSEFCDCCSLHVAMFLLIEVDAVLGREAGQSESTLESGHTQYAA